MSKIQLDDMLTTEQVADWLQMSPREVLAKSKGISPRIMAYRLSGKVIRFHPRAVLAKMAKDNGASPEFIASMFGEVQPHPPGGPTPGRS